MKRLKNSGDLENLRKRLARVEKADSRYIAICGGTGCLALGSAGVANAFRKVIKEEGLSNEVRSFLRFTGCHGFCERGPLVVIHPEEIFYSGVKPSDAKEIVQRSVLSGEIIDRLLYQDVETGEKIVKEYDVPFYKYQKRIVFGNNVRIDPTSIEDYIRLGGYSALSRVLFGMRPKDVIDEVDRAGLRGRGGGGYPAAKKWRACKEAEGDVRYVICNADEGDPGAYMDRSILEGNPHSVLEGMIIGAFAIGSNEGYIYVRHEYPLAVKHFTIAVEEAKKYGLLCEDILGSGFNFDVGINIGGGAFVCGESSALMTSLEGRVGEPRAKYIHMVERGLWEKPSNLNNVETWANVPLIINKGAGWYSKIGTDGSKGTKIFSLVGKINNTGLVEVPMGITLRDIVYKIGGGIRGGKRFKAIQTGGPSGGCIPEGLLDIEVDFDRLTEVGSMMGSGGMIVMDEDTCMVDVARYFINFLTEEACGKCTPCREGVKRMKEILERICEGNGREGDVDLLEELSLAVIDASLCALGGTAPNPVLSTIKYFGEEYRSHILEKKCPAGVCRALITYSIDSKKCTGCMLCASRCPEKCISGKKKKPHALDASRCIKCGVCYESCKFGSIHRE